MGVINLSANSALTNKIEYEIYVNNYVGLDFEKEFISIPNNNDLISRIDLIPEPDVKVEPCKLQVIFHLKHHVNKKEPLTEVDEYLNYILDYLSFEYGLSIAKVKKLGGIYLTATVSVVHGFTIDQVTKMEKEISYKKNEPYKRLYRAALQNNDCVARFMFLYSILSDVLDAEFQSDVEEFIRKCPELYNRKEDRTSTKNLKKKETIYTWLRNQVGHTSSDSHIMEVRVLIERKLNEFSIIVKKAISERNGDN